MDKTKTIATIFLFLLLAANISFAVDVPDIWEDNWFFLSLIAVLLSASLLALVYMFTIGFSLSSGQRYVGFQLMQAQVWTKQESYSLIVTALIILLMSSLFTVVDNTAYPLLAGLFGLPEGHEHVNDAAKAHLDEQLSTFAKTRTSFENATVSCASDASVSEQCSLLAGALGSYSYSPNTHQGFVRLPAGTVLSAVSVSYVTLTAQKIILSVLGSGKAFALFVTLGVFFRCFHPSRKMGGAMIAIGVGFYLFYPIMIALAGQIAPAGDPHTIGCQFGIGGGTWDELIRQITIVGLVMPVLNIMATLTFITELAKFLGSDIYLGGIARVS